MNTFETLSDIPSALIACRVNGIQAQVAEISPHSLLLRTLAEIPVDASLQLSFYRPETGGYISYTIKNHQSGSVQRLQGTVLTRLFFEDRACASAIRKSLDDYARYVEIRSEYGAGAYGMATTGYPADLDDQFPSSFDAQRRAWFASFPPLSQSAHPTEIALELNCAELWNLYLKTPAQDFPSAYESNRRLPDGFLDGVKISRLYIGNPFCRHLIPDEQTLEKIAAKAADECFNLTIVTAELRAGGENTADRLLDFARKHAAEICINDWGMLERAQKHAGKLRILLGTQLNRRRKDPRMQYKAGILSHEDLLSRNALNDPAWRGFLYNLGVDRCEYESFRRPDGIPGENCSLHLPFYQTNTSLWCPTAALCIRGNRGDQRPMESCPGWCERNLLLYPDHLKMVGRWNSLLALDPGAFSHDFMPNFDRWVLNF